jgi:hypothetical protein|tara:strand:- start:13 stop:240 length:228 start_codon:yes stop_codon:yes gene_type:complete
MNRRTLMSVQVIDFYLDWLNNYLTFEKIAEHHGLDVDDAKALISMGRYMHHRHVEMFDHQKEAQKVYLDLNKIRT